MPSPRPLLAIVLAAASAVALAGCTGGGGGSAPDDGRISIVASTSVYGQIAEEIGGDHVDVTSIVSSTSQDPHSFEPSAQDQLAIRQADLVIENGGGYDAFIDALLEASAATAPVLTAVEFSAEWPGGSATDSDGEHGHEDHIEGFNEHVWYDVEAMGALAKGIQSQLESLDPDHAEEFAANTGGFVAGIADRGSELAEIDSAHAAADIFVTEPVPLHLTGAAGLVNLAPDAFSQAVEEGQDVAPATLLEALKLLRGGDVRVVIANAQTGGAETSQVIGEAEDLGIPVLEFAEILPDGQTYLSWMQANIAALSGALDA